MSFSYKHYGVKVKVTREVKISEARLINTDLVVLPRIVIENGNLKKIVQRATALRLPLYTLTNRDAKRLLSSIKSMVPSDFDT